MDNRIMKRINTISIAAFFVLLFFMIMAYSTKIHLLLFGRFPVFFLSMGLLLFISALSSGFSFLKLRSGKPFWSPERRPERLFVMLLVSILFIFVLNLRDASFFVQWNLAIIDSKLDTSLSAPKRFFESYLRRIRIFEPGSSRYVKKAIRYSDFFGFSRDKIQDAMERRDKLIELIDSYDKSIERKGFFTITREDARFIIDEVDIFFRCWMGLPEKEYHQDQSECRIYKFPVWGEDEFIKKGDFLLKTDDDSQIYRYRCIANVALKVMDMGYGTIFINGETRNIVQDKTSGKIVSKKFLIMGLVLERKKLPSEERVI